MGPRAGRTTKAAVSSLAAMSRSAAPAARMPATAGGARECRHEQGKRQLYCQEPHRGLLGSRVPRRSGYRSRAHDLAGSVELDPQQLQPPLVMPSQPEDADWSAAVPEDVGQERERGV